ncbi:nickel-dependent lactate racemase [Oceanobacillus profundus]|uniref:lactate racemase domain-containing protein n=1 Tax=Oceanobacillus profundus TaxID=372463 RepID=UPI00203B5676|nr:lactate racemase domain-containing protein [Oceanobacillus profundus]MCM3399191.1 nickel-dependent lactate racemase [Oceanobacillus profundus]
MILYEIEQKFKREKLIDLKGQVRSELKLNKQLNSLPKKAEIAITAGSRGIDNIVVILKEIIKYLHQYGYRPFIVPAMGSHGGATAEGQMDVLRYLGITEDVMGVQIRSSMEVIDLGTTPEGLPVYMDKQAYHADGIIVVNRIKAHTAFRGSVESGLSKMAAIGLGKQKGASFVHSEGAANMEQNILAVSKYALHHAPISMGLAIIENSYDQTAIIQGIDVDNWFEQESDLLRKSKDLMPSLPLKEVDLLVVEEMGKNYSGTGMDPNIIGRWRIDGVDEPKEPSIKRLAVLDLSEQSFGNAQGIGLADFTTEKLINKIDRDATYMNALTSTFLRRVMFPLYYASERQVLEYAFKSLGPKAKWEETDYIQIPNTLHLNKMLVSESVLRKLDSNVIDYTIERKVRLDFINEELKYRLSNVYIT